MHDLFEVDFEMSVFVVNTNGLVTVNWRRLYLSCSFAYNVYIEL